MKKYYVSVDLMKKYVMIKIRDLYSRQLLNRIPNICNFTNIFFGH